MPVTWLVEAAPSRSGPWTTVADGIVDPTRVADVADQAVGGWSWYRVRRVSHGLDYGRPSRPVRVAVLSAPVNLVVTGGERAFMQVTWDATAASKFRVYRAGPNEVYWPLAVVTSAEFDDYAVSNDVTYSYRVTALTDDELGESRYSSPATGQVTEGGVFSMSRSTVFQGIQFGVETVHGTAVPAIQRLKNMEVIFQPDVPVKPVRYPGSRVQTDVQHGKKYTPFRWQGALDFNLIPVILNSMFGGAALTSPAHTTKTKSRLWTPSPVAPDSPISYTIETGSIQGAEKSADCYFNGLTLKFGKEDASVEGTGFGGLYLPNITPTTDSGDPLPVLQPDAVDFDQIGIYTSPDGATWTLMESVLDGEVRMTGLYDPVFHVRDDTDTFDDIAHIAPDFGMQLTVEDGDERMDFWDLLQNGQKIFIGLKATGTLIENSTDMVPVAWKQTIKLQMPLQAMKPDPGDKNNVFGDAYTFNACDDETFGILQATSVTSIPTIGAQAA